MEERIKAMDGISFREWMQLRLIIDTKFSELKEENIFIATEDILQHSRNT